MIPVRMKLADIATPNESQDHTNHLLSDLKSRVILQNSTCQLHRLRRKRRNMLLSAMNQINRLSQLRKKQKWRQV